jgi:two-component system LytT family sensor kinase
VAVRRAEGSVTIDIRDDGQGLNVERPEGVGLSNTRARLQALFGSNHAFSVSNADGGGVLVAISFPYRTLDELETE